MSEYVSRFTGQEIDELLQKNKDINKSASEINNSMALVDKVESGINSAAVGEIVAKNANGGLEGVGIINEADKIFFPKDGRFPSGSIDVGPGATVSENGGWLQYKAQTLGRDYILLDYELTDQGTTRPVYWERGAEELNVVVNPNNGQTIAINSFTHTPSTNSQINALFFDFAAPVTNLCVEIVSKVTGKPIKYIPNEQAWKSNSGGLDLGIGIQNVLVGNTLTPFSALTAYELELNLNQTVSVKGLVDKPYMAVNRQAITAKNVLLEGEGGGGSSAFTALTDTPNAYTGQADKYVRVKTDESGLEFTTSSGTVDIDGVPDADFLKKGVQAGLLQQDLADVDLGKLDEKFSNTDSNKQIQQDLRNKADASDITALEQSINDVEKQTLRIDPLEAEVNRIKTQIDDTHNVFSYRGTKPPTYSGGPYGQYYINITRADAPFELKLPADAPVNAILSLRNSDKVNQFNATVNTGTINNAVQSYPIQPNGLALFLKNSGTNWNAIYSGYMPNNLQQLLSIIKQQLPSGTGLTIEEIQAQLKDRLHLFSEIQTEFNDELHTFDAIEANMVNRGFSKGFSVGYGTLDTNTPPQDLRWVTAFISPNSEVLIAPTNQGNKFLAIYMPTFLGAMVDDLNLNQQPIEVTESKIVANELEYTVLIAKNQIDTTKTNRLKINFHAQSPSLKGIEIDDGTTDKTEITKINLEGGKLSKVFDDSGEVTLTVSQSYLDGITGQTFTPTIVQSLDKSVRIAALGNQQNPNAADFSVKIPNFTEGVFAKLAFNEPINTDFHNGRMYFSDRWAYLGSYIGEDLTDKAWTVQEGDMLDPNISGGTEIRLGFYFEPSDSSVASNDGYVELKLIDVLSGDYVKDPDGNPIAVRKHYKALDKIQPEMLVSHIRAKGQQKIAFEIEASFPNDIIEATTNSAIYIQVIDKDDTTGIAEMMFQEHTGYNIATTTRYYGYNIMNWAQALVKDEPNTIIGAQTEILGNNLFLDSRTSIAGKIENYRMILKDDGTNLPVFSLGKIFDEIDTKELHLKTLNAKVTMLNKINAYIYALMKWTGVGKATLPILTGYLNDQPIFAQGWEKVADKYIIENTTNIEATDTNAFTVPEDAKQIAMILYAQNSEIPTNLELKDFEVDVSPQFSKTLILTSAHLNEQSILLQKYAYRSLLRVPNGQYGYRYTANNVDTKVPFGVVSGGDNKIINNHAWTEAGTFDPEKTQGDMQVKTDGTITMTYEARCFNETATVNQIQFWLSKVNGDGTFTEVLNSRYAGTIQGNTTVAQTFTSKPFTFKVKEDESYRMFMKSDKADGFFIQSTNRSYPLFRTDIEFDEVTEDEQLVLDKLTLLDQEIVITQAAQDAKCYIELDFKAGKPVLTAKQR